MSLVSRVSILVSFNVIFNAKENYCYLFKTNCLCFAAVLTFWKSLDVKFVPFLFNIIIFVKCTYFVTWWLICLILVESSSFSW